MSTPLIVANWKMNKTPAETEALLSELLPRLGEVMAQPAAGGGARVEVAVAPPFVSIPLAARQLAGTGIQVCAQDCHWSEEGPYTGEISAKMLAEVGCRFVIVGHSERRELFAETNRRVNMKARSALFWGLTPIICVGEKEDERASGRAEMVVEKQIKRCLADLKPDKDARVVIAYEPVWAIGSGHTPTPAQVRSVHHLIRVEMVTAFGENRGLAMPILYGGSVNPQNAESMMALEGVDGALVGGASLDPEAFISIVDQAGRAGIRGE